jgi:hypothetical protein
MRQPGQRDLDIHFGIENASTNKKTAATLAVDLLMRVHTPPTSQLSLTYPTPRPKISGQ